MILSTAARDLISFTVETRIRQAEVRKRRNRSSRRYGRISHVRVDNELTEEATVAGQARACRHVAERVTHAAVDTCARRAW